MWYSDEAIATCANSIQVLAALIYLHVKACSHYNYIDLKTSQVDVYNIYSEGTDKQYYKIYSQRYVLK